MKLEELMLKIQTSFVFTLMNTIYILAYIMIFEELNTSAVLSFEKRVQEKNK